MKTKPVAITALILIGVGLMFICTSFIGGSNLRWLTYALENGITDWGKNIDDIADNFEDLKIQKSDWKDSDFDEDVENWEWDDDDWDWDWSNEFDAKFKRNSNRKIDYDYSGKDIKAFHLKANRAKVYMRCENELSVSIVNGKSRSMYAELSDDGTLTVREKRRLPKVRRWSNVYQSYVIIGIPAHTQLNEFNIELNGAALQIKNIDISTLQTDIDANASALQFADTLHFDSSATDISCNAASVRIKGELRGKTKISCNTGNVELSIIGDENEYSWTSSAALGVIKINGSLASGLSVVKSNKNEKKHNHLDISCNVGSVSVSIR